MGLVTVDTVINVDEEITEDVQAEEAHWAVSDCIEASIETEAGAGAEAEPGADHDSSNLSLQ